MSSTKPYLRSNAPLLLSWLTLVILSLLSVRMGDAEQTHWLVYGILATALLKGWLIVDHFMELRHAKPFWRYLLLAWPICIALITGLLYRLV